MDWQFYALGAAGIWSTSADLVKWADNYRTGSIGGTALLMRTFDEARATGIESTQYGAGIFILPDNGWFTAVTFDGFKSIFSVSPDRQSAVAVLCNRFESKPDILAEGLAFIWEFR